MARSSLVDETARRLSELINADGARGGARLPGELELARRLEVSRPVLREAIGRMKAVGLVTVKHGKGMFVGDHTGVGACAGLIRAALEVPPAALEKFVQLRFAIECEAVRRAAVVATTADLARLGGLCAAISRPGVDYAESVRADLTFHMAIVELSGNELMRSVLEVTHGFLSALIVQTTELHRDASRRRRQHGQILESIRGGDPDKAEAAMRRHRRTSEQLLAVASDEMNRARRS